MSPYGNDASAEISTGRMLRSWQKRRSSFNHDWMKNKYLLALGDWMNLLDDRQEDEELERSFVAEKLPMWEEHKGEVLWLLENFEREMSPRVLLDEPPLSNMDPDTKWWLGDMAHALWLERYNIRGLVDTLASALRETDKTYDMLREALRSVSDTRNVVSLRPLRVQFDEFKIACRALASALEKFPSEVLVP